MGAGRAAQGRAYLLNHANELGESPVQLVEDAVQEAGGQVTVAVEQVCHVPLQQGGGTRLCEQTGTAQWHGHRVATDLGQEQVGAWLWACSRASVCERHLEKPLLLPRARLCLQWARAGRAANTLRMAMCPQGLQLGSVVSPMRDAGPCKGVKQEAPMGWMLLTGR